MKNSNFLTVTQAKILVVDDNIENLDLLSKILRKQKHDVHCVSNGQKALEVAKSSLIELILLDVKMPIMNGYEVCQQLKADRDTTNIPVIFLSALDGALDKIKAFQAGGIDYITKPFQAQEILIRVDNQLKIQEAKNTIQLLNEQLEEQIKIRTAELEVVNNKLLEEIKQRQEAQDKLLKLALHDSITGLPNRNSFLGELKQLLVKSQKNSEEKAAVLLISCSLVISENHTASFPEIKCHLDHFALNQLLMMVAHRLQACLPKSSTLSRFEGNNFAITLKQIAKEKAEIGQWVRVINRQFVPPFNITYLTSDKQEKQRQLAIKCHMGIVIVNDNYSAAHDVLHNAEIAVYQAQKEKLYNYCFYSKTNNQTTQITPSILNKSSSNITSAIQKLKAHFKEATKKEKISLCYQPIFSLESQNNLDPQGLEAFSDYHSYKNVVLLTDFIEDIDRSKLDIYLSNFLLDYACYYLKRIQQQHITQRDFFLTIPFTNQYLLQPQLVSKLKSLLTKIKLSPQDLHIDIMGNNSTLKNKKILFILKELNKLGLTLNLNCLDISYETLKNIDKLTFHDFKIPDSMTARIINSNQKENSQIEIAKIINLAHANQIKVTAKGIESKEQLAYLQSVGCNYGQGNLLSKPLDIESLETFLVWRL